ncbi:hypothetical protein E3E36_09650 [Thermococcus sp. M36]|uniref:hypothetical protein n=1 Tax=Thermococcus sp. M36 TaxID=1638261 RepID=UPI00143C9E51|nr:hypothetical protein [Thermococcus sp. M36]NJE06402.1 hypothetical protein [Thermococcus sp. M36]
MGKLDEFFGTIRGEKKRSELEVVEEIEDRLRDGDIAGAIERLGTLEKEANLFLALRMVVRALVEKLDEKVASDAGAEDLEEVRGLIKSLLPYANGLFNPRYRAVILSDLAILFYKLGDDMNGDIALKTALNMAESHPDLTRDILMNLIRNGLLRKAGYAMRIVRDRKNLDIVLSHLAEMFYRAGDEERAGLVAEHIASPFHRALTLASFASVEQERNNLEKALRLLDEAIHFAEMIEDPDARFELMLKLYDMKYSFVGKSINVRDVLSE